MQGHPIAPPTPTVPAPTPAPAPAAGTIGGDAKIKFLRHQKLDHAVFPELQKETLLDQWKQKVLPMAKLQGFQKALDVFYFSSSREE